VFFINIYKQTFIMRKFSTLLILTLTLCRFDHLSAQWSTPVMLFPDVSHPAQFVEEPNVTNPLINAKTDLSGNLHVVWSDLHDGINDIYYSQKPKNSSVFSAPVNLSNSEEYLSVFPDMIVHPSGTIMLSWTDTDPELSEGLIRFRFLNTNSVWSDIYTIERPENFCFFSSGAYTTGTNQFVMSYNENILDGGGGDESIPAFGMVQIDGTTGNVTALPTPDLIPDTDVFRPTLLNEGSDTIHCIWFDYNNSTLNRYCSYSAMVGDTWTTTTPLSEATQNTPWDDGPMTMVLDQQRNLYVIWSVPSPYSVVQGVIKPAGGVFGTPVQLLEQHALNGAFYLDINGQMNVVNPRDQGLKHYQLENNSFIFNSELVPYDSDVWAPAISVEGGTTHLFWMQDDELYYSNQMTSSTNNLSVQSNLRVFPNISSGLFHLEADQNIVTIHLFNSQGQLVMTQNQVNDNTVSIHLSSQPVGRYHAQVILENGVMQTCPLVLMK
jgi:hypothetical protein